MTEATLSCYTRPEGQSVVLALEGTLDIATAPQASAAIQRFMLEHGAAVVIDTSRLDFIDSKGVGTLIGAAKSARELGGKIYLLNPATPVRKIIETCGLTSLFPPPPVPETSVGTTAAAAAASGNGKPRTAARTTTRKAASGE